MAIYSLSELTTQLNTRLSDASSDFWTEDTIFYAQLDLAESIIPIIQSGNYTSKYSFKNDVLLSGITVQSGIKFSNGEKQTIPYPGAMSHSDFIDLDSNDHPQYVTISGAMMDGNIGTEYYINSGAEGEDGRGITFKNIDKDTESFLIGKNSKLVFDYDNSKINSISPSVNAFISFDSTTEPLTVHSSYNVKKIQHVSKGKFILHFNDNLYGNYIAITSTNGTQELDVAFAKAACSFRKPDMCGFVVQNKSNQYVNSKTNDIIIFSIS